MTETMDYDDKEYMIYIFKHIKGDQYNCDYINYNRLSDEEYKTLSMKDFSLDLHNLYVIDGKRIFTEFMMKTNKGKKPIDFELYSEEHQEDCEGIFDTDYESDHSHSDDDNDNHQYINENGKRKQENTSPIHKKLRSGDNFDNIEIENQVSDKNLDNNNN